MNTVENVNIDYGVKNKKLLNTELSYEQNKTWSVVQLCDTTVRCL